MNQNNIKCPNCSVEIDVDALFGKQMQAKYQKIFEERAAVQNQLIENQKLRQKIFRRKFY